MSIICPYLESYTDGDFCTLYHKICDMSCCITPGGEMEVKER